MILGPSGVGKDTMIDMLKKKYKDVFFKLPSYTTREKRPKEEEGVDYFFVSKRNSKKWSQMDNCLEFRYITTIFMPQTKRS
jgi:guanylate kinase